MFTNWRAWKILGFRRTAFPCRTSDDSADKVLWDLISSLAKPPQEPLSREYSFPHRLSPDSRFCHSDLQIRKKMTKKLNKVSTVALLQGILSQMCLCFLCLYILLLLRETLRTCRGDIAGCLDDHLYKDMNCISEWNGRTVPSHPSGLAGVEVHLNPKPLCQKKKSLILFVSDYASAVLKIP